MYFFRVKKNSTCLYVDRNDRVEKEKRMVYDRVNTIEHLAVDPILTLLQEHPYLLSRNLNSNGKHIHLN